MPSKGVEVVALEPLLLATSTSALKFDIEADGATLDDMKELKAHILRVPPVRVAPAKSATLWPSGPATLPEPPDKNASTITVDPLSEPPAKLRPNLSVLPWKPLVASLR